jgi:hypothetical protein
MASNYVNSTDEEGRFHGPHNSSSSTPTAAALQVKCVLVSAEKQNSGDDDEESSTAHLRSEDRMKPEERARKAAFERQENLE